MTHPNAGPGAARPALRSDARRNRQQLVRAASAVVAEHGAGASLEEIARRAGVGSATLHRHFRTRQALLEAVFQDRVATLCGLARDLLGEDEPGPAFATWLHALGAHAAANRGLGAALTANAEAAAAGSTAHAVILAAAESLLERAQQHRAVRLDVDVEELLQLVNAVAAAAEQAPDPAARTRRLLTVVVDGLRGPTPLDVVSTPHHVRVLAGDPASAGSAGSAGSETPPVLPA